MRQLLAVAALSVAILRAAAAPALADTEYGPIVGYTDGEGDAQVRVFHGVPFAASPDGERRWMPPVAPEPWTFPLPTVLSKPVCPQWDVFRWVSPHIRYPSPLCSSVFLECGEYP
jgi:hypothetical protein